MKLSIESTPEIQVVNGVPCRVWKATTPKGVECLLLIHRIAVDENADCSEFDAELLEQGPPVFHP